MGSAAFLALRYVLIGVAIYAIIEGLGSTPGALIVGLLVSFVALILELLIYGSRTRAGAHSAVQRISGRDRPVTQSLAYSELRLRSIRGRIGLSWNCW